MKVLMTLIIVLLIPLSSAQAHGGFEKRAGETVVYITQSPLSPFVGEQVTVNMVFQKHDTLTRWKDLDVTIRIVDTYFGDESKDKTIETLNHKTDANGSLNITYVFPKENYFDVDVAFTNPETGKTEETGFLIYPRNVKEQRSSSAIPWGIVGVLTGFAVGMIVRRKKI